MNRTALILTSALASLANVYAVDLVGVDLVGSVGNASTNISSEASLNIDGSSFVGGEAVSTPLTGVTRFDGNNGVEISDVDDVAIVGSSFKGSNGGLLSEVSTSKSTSVGGNGLDLRGGFSLETLDSGVSMSGGDGGVIDAGNSRSRAYGGDGLYVNSTANTDLVISGGTYSGGNGGEATFTSELVTDPNDGYAYLGEYYGEIGGALGARGGYGVRIYNEDYEQKGATLTINGGMFSGGDGGTSDNSNTSGDSNADGGHALFTDFIDVEINGGKFYGGKAGIANGVVGEDGYGVKVRDGNLTISDGVFAGNGVWFESHYYESALAISGGNFEDVVVASRYDEFYGANTKTTGNISGGTFDSIKLLTIGDASDEISHNDITIDGASIGTLIFESSVDGSDNTVSLGSSVYISSIYQDGGVANVNQWSDHQFSDATIADGAMNFSGRTFNLDGLFELQSSTASVNFNDGLTVSSGGTLSIGSGDVSTTDGVIESGASVITEYDGISVGSISASGDLTVNSGAKWTIDAGENSVSVGQTFDLADAAGTLTSDIVATDVTLLGSGDAGWLGSITDLQVISGILRATYGESDINVALGVFGDTTSEFGKAMADLTTIIPSGSAAYDNLKSLMSSQAEGGFVMTNTFARTPEVASSLINLQAVFADQILSRSRSKLRLDQVGYPVSAQPAGAAGWDDVRTFTDRMESGMNTDGLRTFSDRLEDSFGYDEVKAAVNGIVPDVSLGSDGLPLDWQTWGRGFGSSIQQDEVDGFAGYDATVAGAMVGVDKRLNNMLIGIGGGYALSILDGNSGNDGKAQTGNAVAYLSTHGDKAFFDASLSYALNSVETESSLLQYTGEFDAHTVGIYVGGGYSIALSDRVLFIPEASLLNTLYVREAYTASSSQAGLPSLNYDDYDQWSHLAKIGATLSMMQKIDFAKYELGIQPEVRAYWMHEF